VLTLPEFSSYDDFIDHFLLETPFPEAPMVLFYLVFTCFTDPSFRTSFLEFSSSSALS
jgi:hypothetical protein